MKNIVEIRDISKYYQVSKRKNTGLLAAAKSMIHREYHEVKAVDHVSFNVRQGEIRALIGPNGAGKSTVLKMLSGVLYPTDGMISVMNKTPWKERKQLVKHIGAVFGQKAQLWWDLPAIDAFHLNKILYRIPDTIYETNLQYFVEHLNLQDVITKPVRQLSLGERMKCEFVCALLHEPPLVILDEPTIGLDVFSKQEIRKFIRRINQDKGTTFIITTHDLDDVEELCENITVINRGTVTFDDTMEHLKTFYAHRKILEFHFAEQVSEEQFRDWKVISLDGHSVKLEINKGEMDMQTCMQQICEDFSVVDMNIASVPIEEVIRDIYQLK